MAERKWTDEQRAEAVALAADHGSLVASERTGIPAPTIRSWVARTRALAAAHDLLPAELLDDTRSWADNRPAMVEAFHRASVLMLAASMAASLEGHGRDAQHYMVSAGIAVDKVQLLAGHATSRTETAVLHANVSDLAAVKAQTRTLALELGYPDPYPDEASGE